MKFIKGITIIFGITVAGEFLNVLLPFPVPSGVYGLFILLALLCLGAVRLESVEEPGGFFLDTMPLMFIPAGVGLINSWDVMKNVLVPLAVIYFFFLSFFFGVGGKKKQDKTSKKKNKDRR